MTKETEIFTRQINLSRDSIVDENSRLVRLSFSSEEPVIRASFFSDPWIEVLGHNDGEADLERLNNSAPLLYNHDRTERDNRIGVVERAWLENGRGYAEVRLSKRAEVEGIWQDVCDGVLRNVSVSYRINERTLETEHKDKPDQYRVVSWTPMEISLVDIPADASVGIGRSAEESLNPQTQPLHPQLKENEMPKKLKTETERQELLPSSNAPTLTPSVDMDALRQETLNTEKQRRTEIRSLFDGHSDHASVLDQCLDDPDVDVNEARKLLLDAIGKGEQPAANGQRIEVGGTDVEKFSRASESAIAVRAGIASAEVERTELVGYTLLEMARKSLELRGIRTERMDKRELVGRAFTHSTSDFPKILENNSRKAMLRGYEEADEVFPRFTRAGNLSIV